MTQQVNPFSADWQRRVSEAMEAVERFRGMESTLAAVIASTGDRRQQLSLGGDIFLCHVKQTASIGDAVWEYEVQNEVLVELAKAASVFDPLSVTDITNSGRKSLKAYNVLEMKHGTDPGAPGPWYVWGVDVYGTAYPNGFSPVSAAPVAGNGIVCPCWQGYNRTDSEPCIFFAELGTHDGACDELAAFNSGFSDGFQL